MSDETPRADPREASSRIEIGGVARAHGIRGEIVIITHDPDSDTLGHLEQIYVAGVPRTIKHARNTQRGWLVLLDGVLTRNDAEALRGARIEVERDSLDLDEGDVLLSDLVGCKVVLVDGTPWGEVAAIDQGPGQDRLVIHDAGVERMVPLVDELVPNIDLDARVVTVDPPVGTPETKL
ncbi:MAG TPA: ribosome maturation factor RimM [Kofleriaceae bacterium]|nr:ribosome maturation factor RimM [Kofleriaceae bacterium]